MLLAIGILSFPDRREQVRKDYPDKKRGSHRTDQCEESDDYRNGEGVSPETVAAHLDYGLHAIALSAVFQCDIQKCLARRGIKRDRRATPSGVDQLSTI